MFVVFFRYQNVYHLIAVVPVALLYIHSILQSYLSTEKCMLTEIIKRNEYCFIQPLSLMIDLIKLCETRYKSIKYDLYMSKISVI